MPGTAPANDEPADRPAESRRELTAMGLIWTALAIIGLIAVVVWLF